MPRRKCKYNEDFENLYPCVKKSRDNDVHKAYCTVCRKDFSIQNKGKYDIQQHILTKTHVDYAAASTSANINSFFTPKDSPEELDNIRLEILWSYHNVNHNLSFRSMDCTSSLIKSSFNKKFSCGRTKAEALITNVVGEWSENDLKARLDKAQFVVLSCDASNRKSTKLLPVLVRYCEISNNICVKIDLLKICDIPNETAHTVSSLLMDIVRHYKLENKIVGFLADNAALNFGSIKNKTSGNVHALLEVGLDKNLLSIGCGAHILHNAISVAVSKTIPIDIENLVFKIYNYFSIFTVRTENLKNFCEFIGCQFEGLSYHSKTRFLSLLPCIEKILKMYEALKSYFLSEEHAPIVIFNFFKQESSEMWLFFLQAQLQIFNDVIKKIESEEITGMEVSSHYFILLEKYKDRLEQNFFPFTAKNLLNKLVQEGNITEEYAYSVAKRFYAEVVNYLKTWSARFFEESNEMKYFLLQRKITYEEFQKSFSYFYTRAKNLILENINDNYIFDSYCAISKCIEEHIEEWEEKKETVMSRWRTVYSDLSKSGCDLKITKPLISFIFTLPGSNAQCERLFSIIKNYWTDEKSRLTVSTLEQVMKVKFNIKMTCQEFHIATKDDVALLQKAKSSKKYE